MGYELLCPRCNLPLKEVRMSHGFFGHVTSAPGVRLRSSFCAALLCPSRSTRFGFTQLAAKEEAVVSVLRAESQ
jgi:hypothetical protein